MSDHRQDDHYNLEIVPPEADRNAVREQAAVLHELDFSRLEMARASLDGAFPDR